MKLWQLETPALAADADIMESNMREMNRILAGTKLRLRPHYKSNKCAAIAHMQIQLGAVGITCAKLSEAEDLADSGIGDILIANQVVDQDKMLRLAMLAGKCRLTVCADDADNLRALSRAASVCGTTVHVLIEYEIGMRRCGVADPLQYAALAKLAVSLPGLVYEGIQAYAGHASHEISAEKRENMTAENAGKLRALISLLKENGVEVHTVSGGSTGTAQIKARQGLYTELQAGSYFFLDTTYAKLEQFPFRNSLFLLASVCSRQDGLTVLDAGVKSLGVEQDEPWILRPDGSRIEYESLEINEEHLKLFGLKAKLQVGEKLLIVPGHCCSTVNLHDKIYLYRGDEVVDRLSVTARGKSR